MEAQRLRPWPTYLIQNLHFFLDDSRAHSSLRNTNWKFFLNIVADNVTDNDVSPSNGYLEKGHKKPPGGLKYFYLDLGGGHTEVCKCKNLWSKMGF